ncbi:hypothetical protein Srot_1598 [Segniliparus rotundus DSM 44985]|uniref:Uncharacterized protein n=1 Tax=Segniliparus rotundus (strain ATCC BAA-972 / CDC 1076 / CIP 108378 / DSM 44985 / JCM 13578) TaxID=640132 RepID=D6Z7Y0_SEGRD|nr:hypothetical protein [Segniliparus rotundus]ADG98060.1 hypothetical protein Srot_1598 [Segniliparus rotundus DSM 44985]
MAGHNDSWRAAFAVALGAALLGPAPALAEPAPEDPPAPPAPAEPWADSCGLFQEAVTAASGALGPLRALPRDGSWNYDDPDVARAAGLAESSLSSAKGKAAAAAGADGIPPQLRTLLDNYGYGVDYLLRSLAGRKDNAVVQVYLGGYDKAVAEASGFCSPPPPAG